MTTDDTAYKLEQVCRLLSEALPLALKQLYVGGVSAVDQQAFWVAVTAVEEFQDIIDYDTGTGGVEYGPHGLYGFVAELRQKRLKRDSDTITSGTDGPASLRREIKATQKPDGGTE